jgi:HAD superfamily hydrolase (TIGR01490 family)
VIAAVQRAAAVPTVAAFDFDGTLTYRDTLVPFLARVRGRLPVARAAMGAGPVLLRTAAGVETRQHAKEAMLIRTVRGWWLDELRAVAEDYAREVVARQLRPDRVRRLRWHQEQGHQVVLVSASPELYVGVVGRMLGCAATLASQLEVDRRGRVTGRLFGANVRGAEKERLLRAWLGESAVTLWAYGDSDGDAELLAMADHAHRLRGREKLPPAPA